MPHAAQSENLNRPPLGLYFYVRTGTVYLLCTLLTKKEMISPLLVVVVVIAAEVPQCGIGAICKHQKFNSFSVSTYAICHADGRPIPCVAASYPTLHSTKQNVTGLFRIGSFGDDDDKSGCSSRHQTPATPTGSLFVVERGGCTFTEKARLSKQRGFGGLVIVNNKLGDELPEFSVNVNLPVIMVSKEVGHALVNSYAANPSLFLVRGAKPN